MLRFLHPPTDVEDGGRGSDEKLDVARVEDDRPAHSVVVDFPRAPVPAGPTFQWERFPAIARELPPIFLRHLNALDPFNKKVPIDPNWDNFYALELAGVLRCLTCRVGGALVGYHFIILFPDFVHAGTAWATSNMLWLDPAHRKGLTGYKLLSIAKKQLQENGVKVHQLSIKITQEDLRRLRPLLRRLGYRATDLVYCAVL